MVMAQVIRVIVPGMVVTFVMSVVMRRVPMSMAPVNAMIVPRRLEDATSPGDRQSPHQHQGTYRRGIRIRRCVQGHLHGMSQHVQEAAPEHHPRHQREGELHSSVGEPDDRGDENSSNRNHQNHNALPGPGSRSCLAPGAWMRRHYPLRPLETASAASADAPRPPESPGAHARGALASEAGPRYNPASQKGP